MAKVQRKIVGGTSGNGVCLVYMGKKKTKL